VEITVTAFPPAKRNMNVNTWHQRLFSKVKNRIKNEVRRFKKPKFFSTSTQENYTKAT